MHTYAYIKLKNLKASLFYTISAAIKNSTQQKHLNWSAKTIYMFVDKNIERK